MAEGISVALPLSVTTADGAYGLHKDLESMAEQNLKMVILTNPGERIMQPDFGAGVRRLLFEPATPNTVIEIRSRVEQQVSKYLPYIDLLELQAYIPELDETNLVLVIRYAIPAANIVKEFSLPI